MGARQPLSRANRGGLDKKKERIIIQEMRVGKSLRNEKDELGASGV
jgi:hypothetical protein